MPEQITEKRKEVVLIGGPHNDKKVDPDSLDTFGYPTRYIVPLDGTESAVYVRLSPSALGYLYTMSDA